VMFAAVAAEAWARTGQGKKAVDTLDLFNPEDPEMGEMRAQLWRARAFAFAATNELKGNSRPVKKPPGKGRLVTGNRCFGRS